MLKKAQERGFTDWISENTRLPSGILEVVQKDTFGVLMTKLRAADDIARAIALGEEKDNPVTDKRSLNEILKSAKKFVNASDYISCVSELSSFHDNLEAINKQFDIIKKLSDKHGDEFLKSKTNEFKDKAKKLNEKFNKPKTAGLVRTAGLFNFLSNFGLGKNLALRAWKKRYPKQVERLEKETQELLKTSDAILNALKNTFDSLSSHRNARKIEAYVNDASGFINKFNRYDSDFRSYYNKNIKGFLDRMEAEEKAAEDKKQEEEAKSKQQSFNFDGKPKEKQEFPVAPKAEELSSEKPNLTLVEQPAKNTEIKIEDKTPTEKNLKAPVHVKEIEPLSEDELNKELSIFKDKKNIELQQARNSIKDAKKLADAVDNIKHDIFLKEQETKKLIDAERERVNNLLKQEKAASLFLEVKKLLRLS